MKQQDSKTQSVDLISRLVGKKLGIAGHEARRLAITGTLAGVTQAYFSRDSDKNGAPASGSQ
ncbi:hypothetical protein [Chania multitudinisentens]|uniref:hypothetical protein n=1 Tax=Chania multitudinisentens TaxID=1639108 RepID=UPI0003E12B75|nr:hypothetical protein [Chania multitudinisentens]